MYLFFFQCFDVFSQDLLHVTLYLFVGLKQLVKSFNHFRSEKGSLWKSKVSKSSKAGKHENKVKDVHINIGLFEWAERNKRLTIRRRKRISCQASTADGSLNIRIKAEQKFSNLYSNIFDRSTQYELIYESGEIVDFLPGTVKKFVLSDYRRELQKDYNRIILYFCKTSDLNISQYPVINDETIGEEENPAKKSRNTEFYGYY